MPDPLAPFSLEPANDRARQEVANPFNKPFVSTRKTAEGEVTVLDIGHIRSTCGDEDTLATLGRAGDILVEGAGISKIQCSFEVNRETGIIMFYDRSHGQTCQVFDAELEDDSKSIVTPFESSRLRRVVVQEGLNPRIGMGGVGRDLVQFLLRWRSNPKQAINERQNNCVPCNPRLARTVDELDTLVSSRMDTRIHTPGQGQPRMRWLKMDGDPLGAGSFGEVWKALDIDTGRVMAAKVMKKSGGELWEMLKREVQILSRISHVSR